MRLPAVILSGVLLTAQIHGAGKPNAKPQAKIPAKTAVAASAFVQREALAKLQAMDIFPDMEREDSEFAKAISAEVVRLESENPAYFKSPAWPLRAARRVAVRLGVKPRTVAEIRRHLTEEFDVDGDAFREIHGIQILSAHITVEAEMIDVTPQLAGRVTAAGIAVDCDSSLLATLAEITQLERTADENSAAYWSRQRKLLAVASDARPGQEALQITFEFHSETGTASAKSGERLVISEEGKVSTERIAPVPRVVRPTDPVGEPEKSDGKPSKPSRKRAVKK